MDTPLHASHSPQPARSRGHAASTSSPTPRAPASATRLAVKRRTAVGPEPHNGPSQKNGYATSALRACPQIANTPRVITHQSQHLGCTTLPYLDKKHAPVTIYRVRSSSQTGSIFARHGYLMSCDYACVSICLSIITTTTTTTTTIPPLSSYT